MKIFLLLVPMIAASQPLRAEPVALQIPSGTLHGTMELPKTLRPCPVALILAGSGATNRDGDTLALGGENDSLRLLAEGLAAQGIASVRYDKRGVAASARAGGKEADLRFENYIDDAIAWGRKLQGDRRFSRLVIIGHSEGSLVGMVAAKNLGASAFISIAGPGRRANQVILEQLKPQLPPELMQQSEQAMQSMVDGKTTESYPKSLESLFRPSVQPYLISWLRYDPAIEIKKLATPVLIEQGTNDLQVSIEDAKLLLKAKPDAEIHFVQRMNHVLKIVSENKEEQISSYTEPALPVAANLIADICRFIQQLKGK